MYGRKKWFWVRARLYDGVIQHLAALDIYQGLKTLTPEQANKVRSLEETIKLKVAELGGLPAIEEWIVKNNAGIQKPSDFKDLNLDFLNK